MPTEALAAAITPIVPSDMADAMALVAEAGWNQVEADWRFMLSFGRGYGIRDGAGRLMASSVLLVYPPETCWIGMVLVAGAYRRRGYATRLLDHAIAAARSAGLTPALDATPAGREVYKRLGFIDGAGIERWRGEGGGAGRLDAPDMGGAPPLDRTFGAGRAALLADLAGRTEALSLASRGAFLFTRRGRTATQLGPLLSASADAAVDLCDRAVAAIDGPVLIDVPARERALRSLLASRGFAVERPFMRMALGRAAEIAASTRAIAGPELG